MLQIKNIILPISSNTEEVNSFLRTHTILNVEKEFIQSGAESFWVFLISYDTAHSSNSYDSSKKIKKDFASILSESQFATFEKLREFRNSKAKEDGVPAYSLFTNDMAEEMVKLEAPTKSSLSSIPNFGKSKQTKYSDSLLAILQNDTTRI